MCVGEWLRVLHIFQVSGRTNHRNTPCEKRPITNPMHPTYVIAISLSPNYIFLQINLIILRSRCFFLMTHRASWK